MDVKELTNLLVTSASRVNQSKFIPWWEDDFENCIYYYDIFKEKEIAEIQICVEQCSKETLLSPAGSYGLTLFHLLIWHNFYDAVKKILDDKKVEGKEIDLPDHKGYGLTPFLLSCCCGNLAMAKLLRSYGADDSLLDKRGMNAYHFLAYPSIEGLVNNCLEKTAIQREEIARMLTCDINQKDKDGLTPLARLLSTSYCSSYTWPLTKVFLDKGAETDYVDEKGNSLLMLSLINVHLTAAFQLMERREELVHVANKAGITPIKHAESWGIKGLCLALVDHGAEPIGDENMEIDDLSQIASNAFAHISDDEQDGVSLAIYLTEKLIEQVDMDDDDELGYLTDILHNALISDRECRALDAFQRAGLDFTMPIHFQGSITCLRDECLRKYFGAGIIRKMIDLGVDMETGVLKGRTPAFIIASQSGEESFREEDDYFREAAELLSKESMEQMADCGRAAIHLAAENGHIKMLEVMIKKGVDVNLMEDVPAQSGATPLHEACANGYHEAVKLLMAAGADDTMKNSKGETPAHCAVADKRHGSGLTQEKRIKVLKELKHLDIPRDDGKTPLMLVQLLNLTATKEMFPVFVESGVDINRTDNRGMTALMYNADNFCYKDTIKLMIQAGADINITDNAGNNALYYSLQSGDAGVARYLIKKGADYNRPNNQGETPVQVAVEKGFDTVLTLMTDIE